MPVGDQNVTAPLLPSPHDIALLDLWKILFGEDQDGAAACYHTAAG